MWVFSSLLAKLYRQGAVVNVVLYDGERAFSGGITGGGQRVLHVEKNAASKLPRRFKVF